MESPTTVSLYRQVAPLLLLVAIIAVALFFNPVSSTAGSAGDLSGWAWSDNIGWISFSCEDLKTCGKVLYGMKVSDGGNLSGYAWSENIGWVSVESGTKLQNGVMFGWLRALSGDGRGWDGRISLNGSNYGVTESNGILSGFAWGSDVVGWVDFSLVRTSSSYTCVPQDLCISDTLYHRNVQCEQSEVRACANGCADAFSCNPECALSYSCSGSTIILTDISCATSNITTCENPYFCSGGSQVCLAPLPKFISGGELDGNLKAIPSLVQREDVTQIFWNVENASECAVIGSNGDSWVGSTSGLGGKITSPILEETSYTLSCSALIEGDKGLEENIQVKVAPIYREF
jgi:hypothetical protein